MNHGSYIYHKVMKPAEVFIFLLVTGLMLFVYANDYYNRAIMEWSIPIFNILGSILTMMYFRETKTPIIKFFYIFVLLSLMVSFVFWLFCVIWFRLNLY